jgi:hypothetical protein
MIAAANRRRRVFIDRVELSPAAAGRRSMEWTKISDTTLE